MKREEEYRENMIRIYSWINREEEREGERRTRRGREK